MATTAQQHLDDVDARITALLVAHFDEPMQSYTTQDGRSYSRSQYDAMLRELRQFRGELVLENKQTNRAGNRGPRLIQIMRSKPA